MNAGKAGHGRPRITLLTQWFEPEPVIKGVDFARYLAAAGYEVEVVTGFPNYPGGNLYPGYRISWFTRERQEGVTITRLPLYPSHDSSRVGRIANYLSFFVSSLVYLTLFARRSSVVYAYHPPLTVTLAAILSQKARRAPVVIDIQDMWPDTLSATGMISSPRILGAIGWVCRWVYGNVARIVVLSPGFRHLLLERGVASEKIAVIHNWSTDKPSDDEETAPEAMVESNCFHVLYAGNIGRAQALDNILYCAEILKERAPRVRLLFLGEGLEKHRLAGEAGRRGLTNVRFLAGVSKEAVSPYLQAADALLVHLRDDPLFSVTIPSKTQAYLAAGKPIVMAVRGDAAEMVQEAGAGVIVTPESPAELACAIEALSQLDATRLAEMGAAGRRYYHEHLSLGVGAAAFERLFRSLLDLSDRSA